MMSWQVIALIVSFAVAASIHLNQHFKIGGWLLVYLRSVFLGIIFIPFAFIFEWPTEPVFYAVAAIVGVLGLLADSIIFDAAAKHGSRLTCLFLPQKIWLAFGLWMIVDPAYFDSLVSNPAIFAAVVFCLLCSSVATIVLRGNDASWPAFIALIPAGLLLTTNDTLVKFSLLDMKFPDDAFLLTATIGFFQVLWSFVIIKVRQPEDMTVIFQRKYLLPGVLIAAISAIIFTGFTLTLAIAPNPSYVSAVVLLSVVWLMLFHKIRGLPDDGNPLAALLFAIGALGLLFLN